MPLQYINPGVAAGAGVVDEQRRQIAERLQAQKLAEEAKQQEFDNEIKKRQLGAQEMAAMPTPSRLALITAMNAEGAPERVEDRPGVRPYMPEARTPLITGRGPNGEPIRMPDAPGVTPFTAESRAPNVTSVDAQGRPVRQPDAPGTPVYEAPPKADKGPAPRRVTSGDAGRLSELRTSLDDLATLEKTLTETPESTGLGSKIGAMLPNAVTEYTGVGTQAKSRQAVIDRVKQVIGKALEGGVLRREDEYKYEKILPTIGDPKEVVTSKLAGLKTAINQRRERLVESLSDAGFDLSEFEQRDKSSSGTVRMKAPNGQQKDVPADQVEFYKSKGATVVGGR